MDRNTIKTETHSRREISTRLREASKHRRFVMRIQMQTSRRGGGGRGSKIFRAPRIKMTLKYIWEWMYVAGGYE